MKKLLAIFAFLFALSLYQAQNLNVNDPFSNEIYFTKGGEKVTEESLTNYFEKILSQQGNSAKISHFAIQILKDERSNNEYNLIVGTNSDGTIKIASKLAPYNLGFYLAAGTVTCKGCTRGCNPRQFGGDWECTDCTFGGGSSGCEKTVTVPTNP